MPAASALPLSLDEIARIGRALKGPENEPRRVFRWITDLIKDGGLWELVITDSFRRLCVPGGLFVNVGAHIGYYSAIAAASGMRVSACEREPYRAEALQKNLDAYGSHQVISGAVSDASPNRLADLIPTVPHLVLIDVDGDEDLVLAGMPDSWFRAPIFLEINGEAVVNKGRDPRKTLESLARHTGKLYVVPEVVKGTMELGLYDIHDKRPRPAVIESSLAVVDKWMSKPCRVLEVLLWPEDMPWPGLEKNMVAPL